MDAEMKEMLERIICKLDEHDKRFDEVAVDLRQTRMLVESQDKKISLIAEQHGEIISRLPQADEQSKLKSRVRVLEQVTVGLRSDADDMKQAQ